MIYFDNSATTKPYPEVLDSYVKVASDFFGNPSSLHGMGARVEKLMTQARSQIAGLIGCEPAEVFFTSGGTESNNLAIKGTAYGYRNRGRHIIASSIEHPSVREPLLQLQKQGFTITFLPVDRNGRVNPVDIEKAITDETILISIMHVNNEVGIIQPIYEIGSLLKNYPKILFHVDGVQGAGKVPLDLTRAGVSLYSFSAHKFHGLKGTGGLVVKKGVKLEPLLSGGSQERGQRGGTENPAGIVAMAKALRMSSEKQKSNSKTMADILNRLRKGLEKIEGITIHTPNEGAAPHILNFSVEGIKSETFVHALEEKGVFISTTSACSSKKKSASKTLLEMGVPENLAGSAARISLSYENSPEEADFVIEAIEKTVNELGKVLRSCITTEF
ncbi:cysteine desulfurase [Bacillus sp. FJAT-27225]|uniref:cysteine desulfurase family protein n=1 Tax=Bacillus sp. FJAT-27225 TaxID=1743144 RepID=UPI00080C2966|nr:cysteine desulfurase family protein [Bacillus sp. FJAT-27225]OCA91396.1 cysteine desulfurase [Bacillus sp. FJAT-27225]